MGDDNTADAGYKVHWHDGPPFAITPVWVLTADITPSAKVLYGLLAATAGLPEHPVSTSKRDLADLLRCSMSSIERYMAELRGIGAVSRYERLGSNGAQLANTYVLHRSPQIASGLSPDDAGEAVGGAPSSHPAPPTAPPDPLPTTGEATRAVLGLGEERASSPTPHTPEVRDPARARGAPKWTVDRKPVTPLEADLAGELLDYWNDETGQSLRSRDWLAKIILRAREHPEMGVIDHMYVVNHALNHPWWSGPASPSVVYGSGAQFERCLTAAKGEDGPRRRQLRYGRGVTATELLDRARRSREAADAEARGGDGAGAVHGGIPERDARGPVGDVVDQPARDARRGGVDEAGAVVDRQRAADADDQPVPLGGEPGALAPPGRGGAGASGGSAPWAGGDAGVGVGVVVDEAEWRRAIPPPAGAARRPDDGDVVR